MAYILMIGAALGTFASPCVIPLVPVLVTFFSQGNKTKFFGTLIKVLAFCIGLSIIFLVVYVPIAFIAHTSTSGNPITEWLQTNKGEISAICGMVLVIMGLKFMGWLHLPFLNNTISYSPKKKKKKTVKNDQNADIELVESTDLVEPNVEDEEEEVGISIISAFIMGLVFSLSIGTCAIGFVVSNVEIIMKSKNLFDGIMLAVTYVVVIDLLFVVFALLLNQLKGVLKFIQRKQNIISFICGIIMIILGVLMAVGIISKIMEG